MTPLEAAEDSDTLSARFDLRERLGGAQTGVVWRGHDKQTKADVAVKLVATEITKDVATAERIERELKQLERIQHPGIAKVIASGKREQQTWIATELIEGARSLAEVVRAHGPLSAAQAAELVQHIGEALIDAAQVGVVHHDLAPKNVLLAGSDLKLINFSVAVLGSESVPGVAEFVSPEQVEGKPADQRSNIYSLGTLFYFALTGSTPFQGDAAAVHAGHLSGTVTPPSQAVSTSPELDALILRALERAPSKRFLTVRQFIDEVVRVNSGVEDLKTTQPFGRAGKPKAELVQTLLGMPGEQLRAAASAAVASSSPPAAMAPAAAPVAVVSPAVAAAPTQATPAVAASDRSPWAPPAGSEAAAAAPAGAADAAPAPVAVAAEVATPVESPAPTSAVEPAAAVAGPTVASPASARRKKTEEPQTKGKFRETMWFKKGELDAAAAEAAAVERERTGKDVDRDKADSLPMDERYKDDGTLSRGDKDKYSLKTGGTQMLPAMRDRSGMSGQVSEDELISEMKRGRSKYVIAIVVVVVAIGILIAIVATR